MQPAIYIAIVALVISFSSLVVTIVSAVKNYRKSKRDAFNQRRDHLFRAISDLNARNSEARLISARFEIIAVKKAGLPLREEQAAQNAAETVSLDKTRVGIERATENWDEIVEKLHFICSNLTPQTDAGQLERHIAQVQVASNNLKNSNDTFLSALHILETTNQIIETKVAEMDEMIREQMRQIDIEIERGMKDLAP